MIDWLLRLVAPGSERFNRAELMYRELGSPTALLLGIALAFGFAFAAWSVRSERRVPRMLLITLRLVTTALLGWIVLGPSIELQLAQRIPTRIAVLVDSSSSMGLVAGSERRIDVVRNRLEPWLTELGERFRVELYGFDTSLRPLTPDGLRSLEADGRRTDLAGALGELNKRDEDGALAGIVLLTDGADTERLLDPSDVERRRADWPPVPIFPVLPADPASLIDVGLVDLRYDTFGFARHELVFDLRIEARGVSGRRIELTLRQDGLPLTTRALTPNTDRETLPLSFQVTPERPGTYLYSIDARPLPGEAVLGNNRVEFAVSVSRDQLRVLLICGRPSWDERFLRQFLKQDPNVDLVSFFILRDGDDSPGVRQDELSLIPFPVNDLFSTELANFDIVILQNFDRRPFLTNLHLDNLRQFVVQGGAVLLVGGDLGMIAGGYAGTAIEEVLPFRLDVPGSPTDEGSFRPTLTESGETHFITRLEPDGDATRAIFAAFPPLDGVNVVGGLTEDAVALLVHPGLGRGENMPVLAARNVGKGRTLALVADTSWYWNFKVIGQGGSNRDYLRLWRNAIRWLSQDPASKFLRLAVDPIVVAPGETAGVRVQALKEDYVPLSGARIRASLRPAASAPSADRVVSGVTGDNGVFRFDANEPEEGFYRVEAAILDSRGQPVDRVSALLEVRADRTEIARPEMRIDLLEAIARVSGGKVLASNDAGPPAIPDRDVFRLSERQHISLWDNALVYGLLLLTLGAEWYLRRRAGLS